MCYDVRLIFESALPDKATERETRLFFPDGDSHVLVLVSIPSISQQVLLYYHLQCKENTVELGLEE